jgi:hydrogenase/urease accessory protein HupE
VARSRLIALLAGLAPFAAPRAAHAHATNTGFGPFYDGLAHLFVTPEDLLTVVAIALLAAMHGRATGRVAVFALPAAWLAGMTAGSIVAAPVGLEWVTLVLMIMLGVFVAVDRRLPETFILGLAATVGVIHGYGNGTAGAEARLGALFVTGIACGVFVLVTLVGGHVVSLRASWSRIAVRVAGSWITAIGLLMLGWIAREGS